MNKSTVALQLYTVRDFTQKDLPGTLKKIKAMGYDAVELAGTYQMQPADFKKLLDEVGLKAVSAHVPIDAFMENAAKTVADYKHLGCAVLSIPYAPLEVLPGGKDFAGTKAKATELLALCKQEGLVLAYHNHHFEFEKLPCGTFILDALYAEIPELQAQLDTGWINVAGQDPVSYINKYSGRCPSVHLKDIVKLEDGKHEDRPVGKGIQDMPSIIKAAIAAGAKHMIVELDQPVGMTAMEAAQESREYLKSIGY